MTSKAGQLSEKAMFRGSSFLTFVMKATVEPANIFGAVAIGLFFTATNFGMYRVICDQIFNHNGGSALNNYTKFDCWDVSKSLGHGLGGNGTEWWFKAEAEMQRQTATYAMVSSVTTTLPSAFANIILGAYGDRRGRKGILLFSLFGLVLNMIPHAILFSSPIYTPLLVVFIGRLIASLTGTYSTAYTASAAYLTDIIKDEGTVSVRMTILQTCYYLGMAIGTPAASVLISSLGYTGTVATAVGFGVLALLSAQVMVQWVQPPRKEAEGRGNEKEIKQTAPKSGDCEKGDTEMKEQNQSELEVIMAVLKESPYLVVDAWRTILKSREAGRRWHLLAAVVIICLCSAIDAFLTDTVFTLFLQKEPLNLAQPEISFFMSLTTLMKLGTTTFGIFFFKSVLRMPDTLITVCAVASFVAQATLLVFTDTTWMLYLATACGASSALFYPCLQALIASVVESDEIGKAFGIVALCSGVSYFAGSLAVEAIYQATLEIYPPLIFVIGGSVLLCALIISMWLHVRFSRGRGKQ